MIWRQFDYKERLNGIGFVAFMAMELVQIFYLGCSNRVQNVCIQDLLYKIDFLGFKCLKKF